MERKGEAGVRCSAVPCIVCRIAAFQGSAHGGALVTEGERGLERLVRFVKERERVKGSGAFCRGKRGGYRIWCVL